MREQLESYIVKVASADKALNAAALTLLAGNTALKFRDKGLTERGVERLLEGFGKKRKAHRYFRVGTTATKGGAAAGGLLGLLGGGSLLGALSKGHVGATIGGGLAGGVGGAGLGAGMGAGLGFGALGGLADALRNIKHVNKVQRLASNAKTTAALTGAGGAGLAAYKYHQKNKGK